MKRFLVLILTSMLLLSVAYAEQEAARWWFITPLRVRPRRLRSRLPP